MANKIQIKRGLQATLPTLDVGEPALTTNSGSEKIYIGTGSGNKEIPTMVSNAVPIAKGGTGSTTASGAKSNIGLGNVDDVKQASKTEFEAHKAEKATQAELGHVRLPETPIAPTLLNGWVDYDRTRQVGYFKDGFGVVRIRGSIKEGTNANTTPLFVLPLGYRPQKTAHFTVSNGAGYSTGITVGTDGSLLIHGSNIRNNMLSLDNISFKAV